MSKIDLEKLEDSQFDVLKEIGNIGAGNATTALATMLNIKLICQYLMLHYSHLTIFRHLLVLRNRQL